MIRDVNRSPASRAAYLASNEAFAAQFELTQIERRAFLDFDIGELYAMGVHALLLRPFTIISEMSETAYLEAIRR